MLEDLASEATRLDIRDLFFELMNRSRYLEVVGETLDTSEAARVTANVSRFAEMIAEFSENMSDRSLSAYMHHLELVLMSGEDEEPAPVDDEKREVFVLAELEQMTVPEIAEAVEANVNTVYSRLRAARREFDDAVGRHRARDRWRTR